MLQTCRRLWSCWDIAVRQTRWQSKCQIYQSKQFPSTSCISCFQFMDRWKYRVKRRRRDHCDCVIYQNLYETARDILNVTLFFLLWYQMCGPDFHKRIFFWRPLINFIIFRTSSDQNYIFLATLWSIFFLEMLRTIFFQFEPRPQTINGPPLTLYMVDGDSNFGNYSCLPLTIDLGYLWYWILSRQIY